MPDLQEEKGDSKRKLKWKIHFRGEEVQENLLNFPAFNKYLQKFKQFI